WKDPSKNIEASQALKLNAENLLELKIIDGIIKEPLGGAHHDPQQTYQAVKQFIVDQWHVLNRIPSNLLLEQRYLKYRQMGQFLEL
ncbi:MAG: acetyl-CoA carboxylase carboxyl transferase subunit alpha, partial [Parachlamydia sp.]|nr:acetyl-CoA carboxylase carboxyl transferase subunit alpha [Parachlamydia sp.]